MRMRKHFMECVIWSVSVAVVLALISVALPISPADAAGRAVRVALPVRSMSFSGLYVAHDKKFYEEEGIDMSVIVVPGIGAMQAMISGSVEFVGLGSSEVIKSHARGLTPMIIVELIEHINMEIIASKEAAAKAGITDASSLQEKLRFMKGRNIGISRTGAMGHFFLLYALAKGGMTPKDINIIGLGRPSALLASLAKKKIDAFVFVPPVSVIPVVKGSAIRLASGPLRPFPELIPFPYTSLDTMEKTIRTNPDLVQRMARATVKGLKFIHEHPAETKALLRANFKKLPEAVFQEALRLVLPVHSKTGRTSVEKLKKAQKFLLDGGAIKKPVDLSKIYTNRFVTP